MFKNLGVARLYCICCNICECLQQFSFMCGYWTCYTALEETLVKPYVWSLFLAMGFRRLKDPRSCAFFYPLIILENRIHVHPLPHIGINMGDIISHQGRAAMVSTSFPLSQVVRNDKLRFVLTWQCISELPFRTVELLPLCTPLISVIRWTPYPFFRIKITLLLDLPLVKSIVQNESSMGWRKCYTK